MIQFFQKSRNQRGISLVEIMVVLVLVSVIMGAVYYIFNRSNQRMRSQSMIADVQTVGAIAFFMIGRDIRRAGSNPAGALGYDVGAPIPFGVAESTRLQIFADLNGDGDILDDDEDIIYEYIDYDSDIAGNDTIRRTAGINITYITNVYNFHINYVLTNGVITEVPAPVSDVRMVELMFVVGTDQRDPTTNAVVTRAFETTIGLRNYQ